MRLTVILPTARSPYGKEAPALPSPHTDGDAGGRPAQLTYTQDQIQQQTAPHVVAWLGSPVSLLTLEQSGSSSKRSA